MILKWYFGSIGKKETVISNILPDSKAATGGVL